jgi:hypothetical protein
MPEKGKPKWRNAPIVEAEIKILKKIYFKCFYYEITFPLRGKTEEKKVKY